VRQAFALAVDRRTIAESFDTAELQEAKELPKELTEAGRPENARQHQRAIAQLRKGRDGG
jgi:hypothetical protein